MTAAGPAAKIRRLMVSNQRQSIQPLRLAKTRERIAGEIQLSVLTRLTGLLLDSRGGLKYSLSFDFDESGLCVVESSIEAKVRLACQRCFEPVIVDIHTNSLLAVVKETDRLDTLAEGYEPLQLDNDAIIIDDLIADELLLSMPLSALHPEDKCSSVSNLNRINADIKRLPFAGLAALMKEKN